MKNDYLWDGAGEPDPEVQRIEKSLAQFRFSGEAPNFAAMTAAQPRSSFFAVMFAVWNPRFAAATLLVLALFASGLMLRNSASLFSNAPGWDVARLSGAPSVGSFSLAGDSSKTQLKAGQLLVTDDNSRASLNVADLGEIYVDSGSRVRLIEVLRGELLDIKQRFATPRRTAIEDVEFEADIEALIQREAMVVTVSHAGYIKRVPLSTYRSQRRGGRGRAGMAIREEDFLSEVFVASTLAPVLFFTSSGRVYKLKVYRLPLGTPQARGRPMVNLLPNLAPGETISTVMPLPEDEESWGDLTVMFATANGYIRRNALSDFGDVRANGKIAMKFEGEDADDRLIAVATCTDADDVLLATRKTVRKTASEPDKSKAIRFSANEVRVFSGRSSVGVRGIQVDPDDRVISMSILRHEEIAPDLRNAYLSLAAKRRRQMGEESELAPGQRLEPEDGVSENGDENGFANGSEGAISEEVFGDLAAREEFVLSVTEKGFGVRSSAYDYRITRRGGQGIDNMRWNRQDDAVVAVFPVQHNDQIMLVTDGGMVIRCPVNDIRIARRGSQGVVIFKVGEGERVVSVARLPDESEENGETSTDEPEDSPDSQQADGQQADKGDP